MASDEYMSTKSVVPSTALSPSHACSCSLVSLSEDSYAIVEICSLMDTSTCTQPHLQRPSSSMLEHCKPSSPTTDRPAARNQPHDTRAEWSRVERPLPPRRAQGEVHQERRGELRPVAAAARRGTAPKSGVGRQRAHPRLGKKVKG